MENWLLAMVPTVILVVTAIIGWLIKKGITDLQSDVTEIRTDMKDANESLNKINGRVGRLEERSDSHKEAIDDLKSSSIGWQSKRTAPRRKRKNNTR